MDYDTLITVVEVVFLAVALPLAIWGPGYFHKQKFAPPIIEFQHTGWRSMTFWWAVTSVLSGLFLVAATAWLATQWGFIPITVIVYCLPLGLAWWCFAAIRLYWTYWQWDGQARLSFDQIRNRISYINRGTSVSFALSEIVARSRYEPHWSRSASADYGYVILHLADGQNLVITSLLCTPLEWMHILPASLHFKTETTTTRLVWLPEDTTSRKFFPF